MTYKGCLVGSVFSKLKLSKGLMAGLLLGGTLGSFGVAAATSTPSTTVFYACLNVKAGTMNHISTTQAPKCATGNINTGISLPSGVFFANGYLITPSAFLESADLGGANLNGGNLNHANLTGADLTGADLSGADLSGADLNNAYLLRADLNNANLTNANLYGGDLRNADLSHANLSNADLSNVDLDGANLTNANLTGVSFGDEEMGTLTYLADANFTGATCPNGIVHGQSGADC